MAQGDRFYSREKKLFLTGASGLLGRAIRDKFMSQNWSVYGTALTRVGPGLHRVDITNTEEVKKVLAAFRPSWVIHCAAQRYPDKVDSNHEAAEMLNVAATANLAQLANAMGIPMLYISTDYVFDGKSPPYSVTDPPRPLNMYGRTKLMGEVATLKLCKEKPDSGNLVLRIPVLFGPVEKLSESAVTVLLEILMDRSKTHQVSDYELRRPSHVDTIAVICQLLVEERMKNPDVHGIFHWCGAEVLTKYQMIQQMSEVFNLPCDHVNPTKDIPSSSTARPYDTTLDISRTTSMIDVFSVPSFRDLIYKSLVPWVEQYHEDNK